MIRLICVFVTSLLVSSSALASFTPPSPPPELGEHLTSYRTAHQRRNEDRSQSRGRVDRMSGYATGNSDSISKTIVSNSKEITIYEPPRKVMREYTDNKKYKVHMVFNLYDKSETVLRFLDNDGNNLKIDKVVLSNKGFVASTNNKKTEVTLKSITKKIGRKILNGTLKVYLQNKSVPLIMVLGDKGVGSEIRYFFNVYLDK